VKRLAVLVPLTFVAILFGGCEVYEDGSLVLDNGRSYCIPMMACND